MKAARPRGLRILGRIGWMTLLVAAGLYAVILGFFFFSQRSLIFPAPSGARPPPPGLVHGEGFEARWEPPPSADGPVFVYFHGNGEDLADVGPIIGLLRSLGGGVLAVEYPGYGVASGKRSESGCYAAGEAALRHLGAQLGIAPSRTVLVGQSLGSGVATELALRGYGARVVLISAYTSLVDVGRHFYPWLPAGLLMRHRFLTAEKAPRVQQPVLLVHGTNDEVIPFAMGETLARTFPHATVRPIPGGYHNDLIGRHGAEVRAALSDFLAHP